MKRVLWIEDQVETDLPDLFAVAVTEGYRMTIVDNATAAIREMQINQYDFVIVDIRIMPGDDHRWYEYFYDAATGNKTIARLGIQLLRSIWNKKPAISIDKSEQPSWLKPEIVGILTVETYEEAENDLNDLNIPVSHFSRKSETGDPSDRLVKLLQIIEYDLQAKKDMR